MFEQLLLRLFFLISWQGGVPNELQDHLAAVKSIQVTLPDEPDGRCSNSLQVDLKIHHYVPRESFKYWLRRYKP